VVIIHNGITEENFDKQNAAAAIPAYVEKTQQFIDIITRSAVPLFFLISAFLLYAKETRFTTALKKRIRTLLTPYVLWTLLFVLLYFVMQSLTFTRSFFSGNRIIRSYGLLDWIDVFAGKFTARNKYQYPFVFQFWFIRDLFILDMLFIPIKKIIDRVPFGAFVLCFILWIGKVNIYVVSTEALFFFALGCYVVKYGLCETTIDRIQLPEMTALYLVTLTAELFGGIPIIHNINILLGCAYFIRLSGLAVKNAALYRRLTWLEQYEFIVYAAHGLVIALLGKIVIRTLPLYGGFLLLEYFGVVLVSIVLCLIFGIVFKRLLPGIYAVLTGGRRGF